MAGFVDLLGADHRHLARAGDGGDAEMVAKASDGKWLNAFWPEPIADVAGISAPNASELIRPGKLRVERLVNLSNQDYRMEPNVFFTLDSKWIIFRSNMSGEAQVYMVEVAKAKPAHAPKARSKRTALADTIPGH